MSWLLGKKNVLANSNSYIKATIDINIVSVLATWLLLSFIINQLYQGIISLYLLKTIFNTYTPRPMCITYT